MVQNFGNGDIDHENVFLFPNIGSVLELHYLTKVELYSTFSLQKIQIRQLF